MPGDGGTATAALPVAGPRVLDAGPRLLLPRPPGPHARAAAQRGRPPRLRVQ